MSTAAATSQDSIRNRILQCLAPEDFGRLQPFLEPVKLKLRQRLEVQNRKISAAYFPERGIASIVVMGNGARLQSEIALVGRDGMTGLPLVLGSDRSPFDVFIQVEGDGHRIDADDLRRVLESSHSVTQCFLKYALVMNVQTGFTALANAHGRIEERLARWLLMSHDRLDTAQLAITHEFLSLMLGVRRAGVTLALKQLEEKGLIATSRGSVAVLDREGLALCANGLYGRPEAETERIFKENSN